MRHLLAAVIAAAVSGCTPAFAATSSDLLMELEHNGATVVFNGHLCGHDHFGGYYSASKTVVICLDRHRGDLEELENTIKHEAVHHVQQCVGVPVYKSSFIRSKATRQEFSALRFYTPEEHPYELEAKVIAREAPISDVIWLLKRFCN